MALLQTAAGSYLPPSNITTVLREDLLELVTIIDPYDTPVLSMLPRREAKSTVHQWITDSLPALVLNNTAGSVDVDGINVQGIAEGFDNPSFGSNYPYTGQPVRQTNFVQMWAAKVGISDTLKNASPAGIRDPYNHELLKATKVIGKAIERRFFDNASANASFKNGTITDPRTMKALFEWATATPALNQATIAGQGGLLSPSIVDTALEAAYTAGGEPEYLVTSVGSKADFSVKLRTEAAIGGSSPNVLNISNIAASEMKIIRSVDIYQGDHGTLAVMMCRQVPQSNVSIGGGKAWLLERSKLGYATYSPVVHIPLAKTGHNTKGIVVGEGTTEVLNAGALAVINNVTT